MEYPVTLTPDSDGSLLVQFPDFPDAVTHGADKADALAHGADALSTILEAYIKDREDIPEPSAGALRVTVPVMTEIKVLLYLAMREAGVRKSELARRLGWHLPQVDRLLDVRHASQLEQLTTALAAMGKRLVVDVEDARPAGARPVPFAMKKTIAAGTWRTKPARAGTAVKKRPRAIKRRA